ncbi:50S ribosomal protein L4 [Spiribacter salinus M19-40]|jgi:large subunit ribosomal protein L4|uniref:Large ribosomal subunit protein uL4 n=1 Tax=Spiribacter salinus M19-40 TaxID=1260251 RepID=R4VQ38_9GAMM|nr:50S ribosomal protein L4 [Spiribacter salinus]AGM41588.1 50S ribosomal protein L4 [Spiribacter salinus M19-40]MBY5269178.1 50S ribosomal protein L4 [Spiribacter salinus]MDR9414158.1 50S ribosomal protein L4 [Spiribacter sp.]MDR9454578.1 50S ribosomal protein L4 [Spiribacter sp.]
MEVKLRGGRTTVELSDGTFDVEFREPLVHQVVVSYMAGGRAGTKAQKTRSEVSGGGSKPWRQKGTGRARAGTIRSPLWRSGGRAFAAKPRDHSVKVNRKMYRGAIRSILSELLRQERLHIVRTFDVDSPQTKAVLAKVHKLVKSDDVLVVGAKVSENLYLAVRNLPRVDVRDTEALDPVTLLTHEHVVMTVDALRQVEEWLA